MGTDRTHIPKVSVLIPVYNRVSMIEECVHSALSQTYENLEVVIVDNASDDGTWEICQRLAVEGSKLRIFRNEMNLGPVRNWIKCAEYATGDFCKILFSDDLMQPDCVELMLERFDQDVAFVFCGASIGASPERAQPAYLESMRKSYTRPQYLNDVIQGRVPVSPGAILFRTPDLRKNLKTSFDTAAPHDFEKHGAGPDVMTAILTLSNGLVAKSVDKSLVFFRAHPGSFTCGDQRNEIYEAYCAVFACFIRKNFPQKDYCRCLAYFWVSAMNRKRRLIRMSTFAKNHEIDGRQRFLTFCYALGLLLCVATPGRRSCVNNILNDA